MTLGRPAKGLPRYYMDVGWYRAPRFVGLAAEALFVFEACVGYSTQHATDGRLPAHPEDLAAVLGLRSSIVRKALKPLIEREALEPTADSLVIRGWADHNPTAAEIEQHTQTRSGAGSYGNHVRWHSQRGVADPDCNWCPNPNGDSPSDIANHRNSDRTSDPPSDPNTIANPSLGMGWDGMGSVPSSSRELTTPDDPSDDEDPGQQPSDQPGDPPDQGELNRLIDAAMAVLVDRDLDARQQNSRLPPIGDPVGWRRRATAQRTERGVPAALIDLARAHPQAGPAQLADLLEPPRPTAPPDPLAGQQRAMLDQAEAGQATARALAAQPLPDDGPARLAQLRQQLPGGTP